MTIFQRGSRLLVPCRSRCLSRLQRHYSQETSKPPSTQDTDTTHFGFKTIPKEQKQDMVGQVFANVASKYDVMNDVMSGGVHRYWKDYFIRSVSPGPFVRHLDVAGGTGDIAFRSIDYIKRIHGDASQAKVTVVDINPNMLQVGQERAKEWGYSPDCIEFKQGNAEELKDIPSDSIDVYTIAFGIRNCTHVDRVLKEAYRVLKKGGRFSCLEFSHVDHPLVRMAYDQYSFNVIPAMGEAIASDRASYQYLVESIRKFPKQAEFSRMIQDAGFTVVGSGYDNLTFGVASIHTGWKL